MDSSSFLQSFFNRLLLNFYCQICVLMLEAIKIAMASIFYFCFTASGIFLSIQIIFRRFVLFAIILECNFCQFLCSDPAMITTVSGYLNFDFFWRRTARKIKLRLFCSPSKDLAFFFFGGINFTKAAFCSIMCYDMHVNTFNFLLERNLSVVITALFYSK